MLKIQPLQFLMMSVNACFEDFSVPVNIENWKCEPPFIFIKNGKTELVSQVYKPPEKKSMRGRKKKEKVKKSDFKSNISFILNRDGLDNRRIKNYNIRLFNGGGIICVGVLREDFSDFYDCMKCVKEILIKYKLLEFSEYNLPPEFYESMRTVLEKNYTVKNVVSTLLNYQFSINYYINIFKLKSFFTDSSINIVNIDLEKFYTFIARKITSSTDLVIDPEILINLLSNNIEGELQIKKTFVTRAKFLKILQELDLNYIKLEFTQYWDNFLIKQGNRIPKDIIENIKYSMLKQYFINYFDIFKKSMRLNEYSLAENIRFKEAKNTLIIEKKKNTCSVTIRVFGTGIINLQGANSREVAEEVYNDMIKIFTELHDTVLYNPDLPPLVKFEEFLI